MFPEQKKELLARNQYADWDAWGLLRESNIKGTSKNCDGATKHLDAFLEVPSR